MQAESWTILQHLVCVGVEFDSSLKGGEKGKKMTSSLEPAEGASLEAHQRLSTSRVL